MLNLRLYAQPLKPPPLAAISVTSISEQVQLRINREPQQPISQLNLLVLYTYPKEQAVALTIGNLTN